MEITPERLRELYEKDFYLWVQENLKLLGEKKYDLVDWENLLEEIRGLGEWCGGCSKNLNPLTHNSFSSKI